MSSVQLDLDTSDYDSKMPIFQRALMNLPQKLLTDAVDAAEQEMRIEIPKGQSGKLENSVTSEINGLEGSVHTNTGYGKAVDEGRRGFDLHKYPGFLRFFYLGKIMYRHDVHVGPAQANNFTKRVIQTVGGRMFQMMDERMKAELSKI